MAGRSSVSGPNLQEFCANTRLIIVVVRMHLFISDSTNVTYLSLFPACPLGGVLIWQVMFHGPSLTCALSMIAHDVWICKTSPTVMLFRVEFPYSKIKIHASDTLSNNQITIAFLQFLQSFNYMLH